MSKKIILLAIVSAGLMFSCQKATIQPNANPGMAEETPVWRSSDTPGAEFDDARELDRGVLVEDIKIDINYITDPNNDEDRNKKRKGNN